jgi:hypothetical protein
MNRQKKNYWAVLLVGLLVAGSSSLGYGQTVDKSFGQLRYELKSQGVSDEFIKVTEGSSKKILATDASMADLKSVLLDLWSEDVEGRALKNAIAAVAELVESGDDTLEAAKITSAAAHEAEAEGLSGFGVGMRVKKSVEDRKAYLKTVKE